MHKRKLICRSDFGISNCTRISSLRVLSVFNCTTHMHTDYARIFNPFLPQKTWQTAPPLQDFKRLLRQIQREIPQNRTRFLPDRISIFLPGCKIECVCSRFHKKHILTNKICITEKGYRSSKCKWNFNNQNHVTP